MSSDSNTKLEERRFVVTHIEKTEAPDGTSKESWYQYIIGHGSSAIRGIRSGSMQSVRRHAEEFAENLNRRTSYGYSAYAARKTQNR